MQISWSVEHSLPQSERTFRSTFWRQIVRADHRLGGGLPRLREEAFVQIALRRARALTLYARCTDLDPAIVDDLRRDSLLVSSEESTLLVAPAHDVLEDWAILQWIEEQHVTCEASLRELSAVIGTHPAVRRAYRKWVAELVDRDPAAADRLFHAAAVDEDVSAQFRDDTFVSLLRAPSASALLERHGGELLAHDKDLLRRVIHLLRVACVITPAWLPTSAAHGSLLNVPDGSAWASVLRLVQDHLQEFAPQDCLLLLGLIEDWGRSVSWWAPYPNGAEAVASIAHWLLPMCDNYRSGDQCKRTMQVIAKIPNADRERFEALLRGTGEYNSQDRTAEDFREIIFAGIEGTPAVRDMPDLFLSVATNYLLCSESDLRRHWQYGRSLDLEPLFGIREDLNTDYFPASAHRGSFLPLLRYHPRQGLDFVTLVFNHSAEWYAHPRVPQDIEPPFEIELTFADGTSRTQWCNLRLWNWYRGSSVGPYVLQSLLMALERWLLELAETAPRELDTVLLNLLQRSESAALTAVVASIATACPHASGETLLVLLRSPMCIWLDGRRRAHEMSVSAGRLDWMLPVHAEDAIYEAERKEANAQPHRQRDLEAAVATLQLGPLAARVHEILDQHRAALPPISEQADDDRVWRLVLHRMDLRQYTITERAAEDTMATDVTTSSEPAKRSLHLELKPPEPDVKEMADKNAARFEAMNAKLGLLMWGRHVFKHADHATYDPTQWRQRLVQAQSADATSLGDEEPEMAHSGPGVVAAVCMRDHWEEMLDDERQWAIDLVCAEVMRHAGVWNRSVREQQYDMLADRPCAWVLPLLLGQSLSPAQHLRVHEAFVTALTHAIGEVRWYAAWGVATHLWSSDRELALRCVNALATEATLVERARDVEKAQPYHERRQMDDIEAEAAHVVRQRFWQVDSIAGDAYETLDISKWFGAEANARILAILGQVPTELSAIAAFRRAAETLVAWWDTDNHRNRGSSAGRRERNHQTESVLSNLLQNFVMRTSAAAVTAILQPILDAVDRHPREVHWLVQGLAAIEDREPNTPHFWLLWELFADRVRGAQWLARIDDEYSTGHEMVSAIFLGLRWKEEVRHWRSLEGHANHVHALFEDLPPSSRVLDDYVRFLYHIGEQSLPEAFVRIAKRLRCGDSQQMLRQTNTVFLLEVLLQRHVYRRPLELKRDRGVRDAVLLLLDLLVANGSSAAFRMRDDFVTPVSNT
jgi:hypothetical protein